MNMSEKLRAILETEALTMAVAVHDPMTARLAEAAGFDNVFLSGNSVAAFQFGLPDLGFITLTEMVDVCRRVAGSITIPVQVDADTGYGNAIQVTRTVLEFERAGAAGINLEDQIPFKRCTMMPGARPVVSAAEHVAKIRAATQARSNPSFVIGARIDAAHEHGIEEAIHRAHLYAEAGADLLDIELPGTDEEVRRIAEESFGVPLMANMDEGKQLWRRNAQQLLDAGYRYAVYPGLLRYTMLHAAKEALAHLRNAKSSEGLRDRMCTVEDFFHAVDLPRYLEMEDKIWR